MGISQAIFASVLLFTKRPISLQDKIMIAWLVVMAFRFWLVATGITHSPFFDIGFSEALIPMTFGPFLYLYCKYLINENEKMPTKDLVHFIPFIFLLFYELFQRNFGEKTTQVGYDISINLLFMLSTLIYSSLVFILLRKYRKTIRFNIFSYDTSSNRLFWLNYVAIVSVVSFSFYLLYMLVNEPSDESNFNLQYISTFALVVLAFSVSYFGVTQKSISNVKEDTRHYGFRSIASDLVDKVFGISNIGRVKRKTESSQNHALEEIPALKKKQIKELKALMVEDKPYLNTELTLQDLADKINIPKHQLTALFNNYMGVNFFEFVNEYRIEEAKKRLVDETYEPLTIIAIAYDCGFNSKSTFNTLFKEMVGKTPSQYRKNKLNHESS